MFIVALFTIAKTWKQQKCPLTDEWTKKTKYIYMCVCVCVYTYVVYMCVYIYIYIHIYIHTHKNIYNGILLSQ